MCKSEDECLPISKVCDGKTDCLDKSDEFGSCNEADACQSMKCSFECKLLPSGPTCICKKGSTYNNKTQQCEVS